MFCRENMEALLREFSGLVRLSGKEDGEKACDYITQLLDQYGVSYQVYKVPLYVSNPVSAQIRIRIQDDSGREICIEKAALPRSFSGNCEEGECASIFYDTKAHSVLGGKERDAWYSSCRGKIIVSDNFYEDYVQRIISYGAAGLIHVWTSEEEILHNETVCPVWGTAEPGNANTLPQIPIVGITRADGEDIFPFLVPGTNEAAAKIVSHVEYELTQASFPVAEFEGETDSFILIGNHFDSWHEGVTDNGTGNALALELARQLVGAKKGRRGVKIAWWPAHSNGRYAGSTWYCDNHFTELYENCIALINIDSPGCMGAAEVGFSTSQIVSESMKKMVLAHTQQEDVVVKSLGRGGDASFFGPQIPIQLSFDYYQKAPNRGRWHCAGCGGGWWWHTTADTIDKVDYDYLVRDGEIIWDTLEELRNVPNLPFDSVLCLNEMERIVEAIDGNSDPAFNFQPVRRALDDLRTELAGTESFASDAQAKKIGGRLTQILFSACDEYHFDNTFSVGQFPGLQIVNGVYREETDEKDFLFLQTAFVRQRNRVVTELGNIRNKCSQKGRA